MANFKVELPEDVMKSLRKLEKNSDEIFGAMTEAGAEVVRKNIKANAPKSFRGSNIMKCLKVTQTFKTPSDGGINTKVAFYGYFKNKEGRVVPAPLVANVFEYGRSNFTKRPFLRKSFNEEEITNAMLEAQKKASGGLLDE